MNIKSFFITLHPYTHFTQKNGLDFHYLDAPSFYNRNSSSTVGISSVITSRFMQPMVLYANTFKASWMNHHTMQYSHTKTNTHMLPLKPSVQIPSGCESGQKIDKMEEIVKAMMPPMRRMAAGLTCQKNLGPVLALKSVKKSDTETLR